MNGYPEIDGYFLSNGSEYRINNCGDQCNNGHILVKLTEEMLNPDPGDEPEAPEDGAIIVHKSNVRKKTLSSQFCEFCIKFC